MDVIVLATRNAGKIREFSALMAGLGIEVKGLGDFPDVEDVEETGTTFEENALLKARAVSQATGLTAVADDSGICVDALGGAPGVYSARYAGGHGDAEANNAKLLLELTNVPDEKRTARFVCVVAAARPDGATLTARGEWEGRITHGYAGKSGFGYDPIFFDPELDMTAAQMTPEQKNARSHRGKALQTLMGKWRGFARG
ncbi:MAG: XTP/dITP diphosphatase [Desulfovibrio aminophilus]|uniref:XTP/dITP diphosphatase n=1 Tax=Desulfovibrio aminophilus TaxID=81425 RepID=UPI0039E96F64